MNGRAALAVPAALALVASVALARAQAQRSAPRREAAGTLVVAQLPAGALPEQASAGGSLRAYGLGEGGRLVLVSASGAARVLAAGFESATDPEVSFDGKSILFAGRKAASDPWCVFETASDGRGEPRRITCGMAGARQPIYQSTLFTITPTSVEPWVQVAFVGENPGERNEARGAPNTSLWSCRTDGTALRRLTFNLSNDVDPVILPDGRMVYAGWLRSSVKGGAEGRVPLVGVNLDGTDYQVYADEGLRVKQMPAPTTNGLVVFVEADRIAGDGGGRLAVVDQVRPLHSYRSLSGEADGSYRAPAPLPDGRVLVSWRPAQGGSYGVYRFDPATGVREKVFSDPAWHSVAARLVAPRPVPDARSSVVREDDPAGKIYAIDVSIQAPGEGLPKGAARTLRVVEGVPATESRPASRRLLGDVPLAEDGSFQVTLPANTPVKLELVDAEGRALKASTWLWVRNHAAQGCVGCHEDPERVPPNRVPRALLSPAPVLNPPVGERQPLAETAGPR